MPTPLSTTRIFTPPSPSGARLKVRRPSERPASVIAYLALRIRLTRICRTLCFSVSIGGTGYKIAADADLMALEGGGVNLDGVFHKLGYGDRFEHAGDFRVALLHGHDLLDVIDVLGPIAPVHA